MQKILDVGGDTLNEIYKLNDEMKIRQDSNKVIMIFNPKNEFFYELNETAAFILKLCNGKNSMDNILKKVKMKFKGDKKVLENETLDIIKKFEDAKIIKRV